MQKRELFPPHAVRFQATRASGPGGQRVNKRATKVRLWVPIEKLAITDEERALLSERLAHHITKQGELEVMCESERFQVLNREAALEELARIIENAIMPPAPRIPTEPPRSQEEQRHLWKEMRSEKKHRRHRVDHPEVGE